MLLKFSNEYLKMAFILLKLRSLQKFEYNNVNSTINVAYFEIKKTIKIALFL